MANLADPSSLTDEELDKLIAGELLPEEEEGTPPAEPVVEPPIPPAPKEGEEDPKPEPKKEDEEPTPPAPAPAPAEEEEPDPVVAPSRREQLRIQQLLSKMKQEPRQQTNKPVADPDSLNYAEELDADPEIIKRLEDDRKRTSDASYDRAVKLNESSQWQTLLYVDAPQIEAKYKILNPKDTENFHPVLAEALTQRYLNMVGYDPQTKLVDRPNIRWSEFVESEMELADEIAATRVASTTTNLKKQAATTALRPDGSSSATKLNLNQAPESMTDEELDAYLASAFPKR